MTLVLLEPEDLEPEDNTETVFTGFLKELTCAKTLVEVNVAAGIALEALLSTQKYL